MPTSAWAWAGAPIPMPTRMWACHPGDEDLHSGMSASRPFRALVARAIYAYSWPGNIRELQSILKQTLLPAAGPVVTAEIPPRARVRAPRTLRLRLRELGLSVTKTVEAVEDDGDD
jgi:DNA-binding NtrC family response regulator